ncbi:MAG TPA: methyltransferase domain-containing protein [Verrucomicrobiae bacterium]|jgi:SAM-dependent methyltransferase
MTKYEVCRLAAEPFLPLLHGEVRRRLRRLVNGAPPGALKLLDVGGRKSPYTIGLPVSLTIIDIPREGEVREALNLGLTQRLLDELRQRRSNLDSIILEDMTQCTQPSASFDGIVCVEVIEHVLADDALASQMARVLKPGGWLCLTTPNGDYIRNEPPHYNPDHVRHYTRQGLTELLSRHFSEVKVRYAVKTGKYRFQGLRSFDARRPLDTMWSMACNVISRIESRGLDETPRRTAHLFAIATKA